jgi:hypothetical protein
VRVEIERDRERARARASERASERERERQVSWARSPYQPIFTNTHTHMVTHIACVYVCARRIYIHMLIIFQQVRAPGRL